MSYDQAYQHVEKFGTNEVRGIEDGEDVHVFPKLDGTNAVVWYDGERVRFGSRRREINVGNDNQGFASFMSEPERMAALMRTFFVAPSVVLYFEWLVPHTIQDYKESAWCKAYLIDVFSTDEMKYWPYTKYRDLIEAPGIVVVPPCHIGTVDFAILERLISENTYLMREGSIGEGVVVKRYDFINRYGRTTWAKCVRSEFKEQHRGTKGTAETKLVEEKIVDTFLTKAIIEKVYANIVSEEGAWESKLMPRFLYTCYYDLIRENAWEIVKDLRNPTVNFKTVQALTFKRAKVVLDEILMRGECDE